MNTLRFIALSILLLTATSSEAGKKTTSNDAIIYVETVGGVTSLFTCTNNLGRKASTLGCKAGTGGITALADLFYDREDVGDGFSWGETCFSEISPELSFELGSVQLFELSDGTAETWFRFTTKGKIGEENVTYVLELTDPLGPSNWSDGYPPPVGTTSTMTGTHWLLRFMRNKERHSIPCVGEGTFPADEEVTICLSVEGQPDCP